MSNGAAALVTSSLTLGSHTLTASYGGDANNNASTSAPYTEVINAAANATTITLSATPNPALFGQAVTMVATVSPAAATGSVTFKDGTNTMGMATIGNGTATLITFTLSVGSHSLQASYSGDANFASSQSALLTATVTQAATATTLSASPAAASPGQPVTLSATVTPSGATGTVVFKDTTVQNRRKSSGPCCKRGLCVPENGILRLRSAVLS
jgi:hypothetical protein